MNVNRFIKEAKQILLNKLILFVILLVTIEDVLSFRLFVFVSP